MSNRAIISISAWSVGLLLAALLAGAIALQLERIRPQAPAGTSPIGHPVDDVRAQQAATTIAPLQSAMTPRFAALQQALIAAKAEIHEVPLQVVSPATTAASIVDASGTPLPEVSVMPLAPNGMQPCTTPAAGLHGKLQLITSAVLAKARSFTGCIAVVDAAAPPRELGLSWERYADLGFSGVLVTHREGLAQADWSQICSGMVSSAPLAFPRGVASPAILDHDGAEVVLQLRQELRPHAVHGLVARLPAAEPSDEAIVLLANLDEVRAVSDLAAAPEQRLGAAWLQSAVTMLGADSASRRRDVLVVAAEGATEAQDGLVQLIAALGQVGPDGAGERERRRRDLSADITEAAVLAEAVARLEVGWLTPEGQAGAISDPAVATVLTKELSYVLGEAVVAAQDQATATAIVAARDPADAAARTALIQTKRTAARLGLLVAFEPAALVQRKASTLADLDIPNRLRARLAQRRAELAARIARRTAELELATLMGTYHRVLALSFAAPGDGQAAWAVPWEAGQPRAIVQNLIEGLTDADPQAAGPQGIAPWRRGYQDGALAALGGCPLPTAPGHDVGWPSATLVSLAGGRRLQRSSWPTPGTAAPSADSAHALPALRFVQRLAAGARILPKPYPAHLLSVSGTVLASGIGGSAVPTHPLAGALVGDKPRSYVGSPTVTGLRLTPLLATDLSGHYQRQAAPRTVRGPFASGWSPTAVTCTADGLIDRHSDESPTVQNVARSLDLGTGDHQDGVHLICFQAVPVALLDRVDPRTMRSFAGVEFARINGLSTPDQVARYDNQPGPQCWFVRPDERLAVLLKTGSEDNQLALHLTSFLLGQDGRGLLAADGPFISEAQRQSAASLAAINSKRLTGAVGAGLADQRTVTFDHKGDDLLHQAGDSRLPLRDRILAARDSGTYGQIVYAELRASIAAAIGSIVWYLFLLVPFAFFLERLVFGFADIRRAITAHAVIFLTTFTALGLLHPAFRQVGSPIMILLGFVILLISLAVSGLFLARAKENLAVFSRRRGGVAAAQADLLGIIGTSIALGINGLSRRKVRTGLTCATLSLITLCLILFVSARSSLVETTKPNGPAAYQGFLVGGADGRAVPVEELLALRLCYGQDHPVMERKTSIGVVDWSRNVGANPEIPLTSAAGQTAAVHGLLQWSTQDPLVNALHMTAGTLSTNGLAPGVRPLAIPAALAQQLGITAASLPAPATFGGGACAITGIFDAPALASLRDLDGRTVLPFDLEAMTKLQRGADRAVLGRDDDPHIDANAVILTDDQPLDVAVANLELRTTTSAVVLNGLPFRKAKILIDRRLEQTGQPVSYGLDGIAVNGRTARTSPLDGLAEMLIPLLIAGLTVLNTMRGSVYERRDEIAVYNAVGIAPRFISAMFFAEALVFAVVGAVLGYLLSLVLGRSLGALGWDGGLQVDYASLTPVWASLALAAVVFLSTWFPARAAAEIAAPSDDAGWTVPAPTGDALSFALPFAFGARDRIAVLAFFHRVFADHGEGGGGSFQCDAVNTGVTADTTGPVACISCRIWLKPFDLSVAQELLLALRADQETGEWLAHLTLTRCSGTREAWLRLNQPFIAALRQRFLHWRAVDAATRDELHAEAVSLLRGTHVHV